MLGITFWIIFRIFSFKELIKVYIKHLYLYTFCWSGICIICLCQSCLALYYRMALFPLPWENYHFPFTTPFNIILLWWSFSSILGGSWWFWPTHTWLLVCPILSHPVHNTLSPSYTTTCLWSPIAMDVSTGISRGTWMQIHAYQPLKVADVHVSILSSFPSFLPTFSSISLS